MTISIGSFVQYKGTNYEVKTIIGQNAIIKNSMITLFRPLNELTLISGHAVTVKPTFSIGELVHVGRHQFSVIEVGRYTYTLSPNVGGGGGANVIALKKYVTKDSNHSPEGQLWLNSLDSVPDIPLSKAKCSMPEDEKEYLQSLAIMKPRVKFSMDHVADFAFTMFGYTPTIFRGYDELSSMERDLSVILNEVSCDYNIEMYKIKTKQPVDEKRLAVQEAKQMDRIFRIVTDTGMFTTRRHGIVYRSFIKNVPSAKAVCGMPMNRIISTTLVKMYADKWGQCKDPDTERRNTEGFYSTIIIPAGTRSIIPSLLLPDLHEKKEQFEVVLSPDGMFKDTGFVDSTGSKIIVYLDPHRCDMPMDEILMMEVDGTNILGFIQCVFGDLTYAGLTGGKTRRNRRKYKSKKSLNPSYYIM